jgi:hypothetical protein
LRGSLGHVLLDAITDPEADAGTQLHRDLIDSHQSATNGRWAELRAVQRYDAAGQTNSLEDC